MTEYSGVRSLDAEITLDFLKNDITMDYTLNKLGDPHMSNRSVTISDEWDDVSLLNKLLCKLIWCIILPCIAYVAVTSLFATTFFELHLLPDNLAKKVQFFHQTSMKQIMTILNGTVSRSVVGKSLNKEITITMRNNLWCEYELEGDYKDKVTSISLKRSMVEIKRYGIYKKIRQSGWDMVFIFSEPPQHGSCKVTWINL